MRVEEKNGAEKQRDQPVRKVCAVVFLRRFSLLWVRIAFSCCKEQTILLNSGLNKSGVYFFFLSRKNSSGWQSRLGVIVQNTTGDPGSLCLCVPPSLVCSSHPHGQKMALEIICIERILKTERRGKAKEACQLTLLSFQEFSQKLPQWHLLYTSLIRSVTLPIREVGKCSFY